MSLSKADIVNQITKDLGYSRKKSIETINCLFEILISALESGDEVLISGFGKFVVQRKASRRGRNPATGDEMMLPPRRRVAFKCSGKLREYINREGQ